MKEKLMLCVLFASVGIFAISVHAQSEEMETETVHVICDVTDRGENWLEAEMPNGEIDTYEVEDLPEDDLEIVVFETENQDDYTTYRVVGVR